MCVDDILYNSYSIRFYPNIMVGAKKETSSLLMVNNLQCYSIYNLPYNIQATTSHIEIWQTLHILMVNYM